MICVVLPAFNEELSIEPLFTRIEAAANSLPEDLQILLVDDGSSDGTIAKAEKVARQLALKLSVVAHKQNMGLGEALKSGLLGFLSLARPGDVACTMDCDDTQPPELIDEMLSKLRKHRANIVIASRYQKGAKVVGLAAHRLLLSHGASWLFRTFAPIPNVKDYTSGFRLYEYDFLKRLLEAFGDQLFTERGFSCMSDILLKSRRLNPRIFEVGMVLRYDKKPTESKMKIMRTISNNLAVLGKNI